MEIFHYPSSSRWPGEGETDDNVSKRNSIAIHNKMFLCFGVARDVALILVWGFEAGLITTLIIVLILMINVRDACMQLYSQGLKMINA